MIRVLIADASVDVQSSITRLLHDVGGFVVVGAASSAAEVIELSCSLRPNIVILDSQLPGPDGVVATRRLKQLPEALGVLVLAVFPEALEMGRDAGADGVLMKDCEPDDLVALTRQIASMDWAS